MVLPNNCAVYCHNMSALAKILSSRVKAEVFRLLFGVGVQRLHLREIERRSGLAVGTVRQELKRLAQLGLVDEQPDGNRTYYSANRQHPLYPDIHNIVLKTSGMVDVLRDALQGEPIDVAFVFGSIARGEEQPHSDIDLMVIGSIGLRQLSRCLTGVSEMLGREINPHILTAEEFRARKLAGDHFLSSVLATPRLFMIGCEHELETMG